MFGFHRSGHLSKKTSHGLSVLQPESVSGMDWGKPPESKDHPGEKTFRVMGVDLGQSVDHAAACVIQVRRYEESFIGPRDERIILQRIRRYPNGVDYTDLCANLLEYPSLDVMVVEYNGVGRPVVDVLRKLARQGNFKGRIVPVLSAVSRARMHLVEDTNGTSITVPKIDLVSSINVLVQSGKFVVHQSKMLAVLREEIRDFQMRYTKAANLQFGNVPGKGKHDDLVIALGLASWWVTRFGRKEPGVWIP